MRILNEKRILIVSFLLMGLALLAMGQAAIKAHATSRPESFFRFASVVAEVYEIIRQRYVDDVDDQKLFEASVQGMFTALDDHSQFMDADSYEYLNKETGGGFSGVGIHITLRNGVLTVISPIPGSPSARMGVQPWDRIVRIEDESTENITMQEAVSRLTGPQGTTVKVSIYRPSERRTFDLDIIRAHVKVDSIHSRMIDDLGYVRVTKFSNDTSGDLKTALLNFHSREARGVILDLRYNTGGLLKEAVDVSDLFLNKGDVIVSTRGKNGHQNQVYKSEHEPVTRLPVIVLVNSSSASASEIVAAAIQENDRGILLGPKGQRTYGKWSVQTIEELKNSIEYDVDGNPRRSAIRLTTARYYSPRGESHHQEGLAFDEELEISREDEVRILTEGGLLGDPTMIESESDRIYQFPTDAELEGATPLPRPTDATPEPPPIPDDIDLDLDDLDLPAPLTDDEASTPGATASQAPLVDLLLDHAVHLMRARILTVRMAA